MKLRYTLLSLTFTLILLSAAAHAADDPQIHSFATAPERDQFSTIGKSGKFVLVYNQTSEERLFSIQKSHVTLDAAALSSDNRWVAFGTSEGLVLLYDSLNLWRTRKIPSDFILNGHDYAVKAVAFSPDNKMLASGAADGTLQLSTVSHASFKQQSSIPLRDNLRSGIQVIKFSPNGRRLAAGRENATITLWDIDKREIITSFGPHDLDITALAFSSDGMTLASGTSGSELKLWDVSSGKELTSLTGHDGNVGGINALAFSPDGKLLASGAADKKALLWDTETRENRGEYTTGSPILSVAFTAEGLNLIVGDQAGKITRPAITDFRINPLPDKQDLVAQQTQPTPGQRSTTSRFQRGGRKQQTQNNTQRTAEVKKQEATAAKLYTEIPPPNSKRVHSIAFAPSTDKPTFILGQQNYFLLTTAQQQHQRLKLPNLYPGSTVVSAAFSSTLKYTLALSPEGDNLLLFHDSLDDRGPAMFSVDSSVNVVTYSPDSSILAVGTAKKVSTRNTVDGNLFLNQIDIPGIAKSLAFSPNSEILAVGSTHGIIQLWDVFKHTHLKSLNPKSNYGAKSLAFSPNGKLLAVGRVITGEVELWNVLSEQKQGSFTNQHHGTVHSVAFSPNGKTLASGAADGKVLLWDVQTQTKIDPIQHFRQTHPKFDGTGHGENTPVLAVAFSDNGKTLMSGDDTGRVLLWDLSTIDLDTGPSTDQLIAANAQQEDSKPPAQIAQDNNEKQQEPRTTVKKPDRTAPKIRAFPYPATVRQSVKTAPLRVRVIDNESGIKSVKIGDKDMSPDSKDGYELTVSLEEGDNPFTLTVTDKADNSTERPFTIHRIPTPPKIEVMGLQLDANNSIEIPQGPFEIKVSVTDESDIEYVKCDDEAMEYLSADSEKRVYRKYFKDPLRSKRTFKITAKDTKGDSEAKEEITLIPPIADEMPADKTPPMIAITEKKRTVEAEEKDAYISGTIRDADSGISSVKIGNAVVSPDSTGYFKHRVTLKEGDNTFIITATDKEQNTQRETVEIYRLLTQPDITVIRPVLHGPNSAEIRQDRFEMKVEVTDESEIVKVMCDNQELPLTRAFSGSGVYSAYLPYPVPGPHTFRITAEDIEGGKATREIVVTHAATADKTKPTTTSGDRTDNVSTPATTRNPTQPSKPTTPPSPTTSNQEKEKGKPQILLEESEFTTEADSFPLVIRVFDKSEILGVKIINVNTKEFDLASKTRDESDLLKVYEINLPIRDGENEFKIEAQDKWFNEGEASVKIVKLPTDKEGPTIEFLEADNQSIRSDGASITVRQRNVRIRGSVTDNNSDVDSVYVNSDKVPVNPNGSFQTDITLADERNSITVTATDTAGNPSTRTFTIDRQIDAEGPTITINVGSRAISPTELSTSVTTELVSIHGNVFDESGVDSVLINDEPVLVENGTFKKDKFLNNENTPITVKATDRWGNHSTRTFTIDLQKDAEGPKITINKVGSQVIFSPNDRILVTEERPLIRGSVADESGVKSVLINGKPVPVENDFFEGDISLDYGKNSITITAIDKAENSNEHSLTITQRFDRSGKDFAIFFATNTYRSPKDDQGTWEDLESPIQEATDIAENLRNNYDFTPRIFENLTQFDLITTLLRYRDDFEGIKYAPDSQLLIFFSGHGYYNEEEDKGYLITADTRPLAEDPAMVTALPHEKLRTQINLLTCPRILVLLDTCFSGMFDPDFEALKMRGVVKDDDPLLKQLKDKLELEARWVVTAAGDQFVADGKGGPSPFAEAFLNALNTKGGDDTVLMLDEVWVEIQKSKDHPIYNEIIEAFKKQGREFELPEPRKNQFGKSTHSKSDFLFFPKIE